MTTNDYPKHLTEPERLEVAYGLIEHELKKLFPNLTDCDFIWKSLVDSISSWLEHPERHNLAKIRDFWNGFDGIMNGFNLKEMARFISAENIKWQRLNNFPIGKLKFGSLIGVLESGYESGQLDRNPTAIEVRRWLSENQEVYIEAKNGSKNSFKNCEARLTDPIIVEKKELSDGSASYTTHDGNGRLLRKILDNEQEINVFLGEFEVKGQPPTNYWVSTAYLIKIREDFQAIGDGKVGLAAIYKRIYEMSQSESMKKELPRALEGWSEEEIENIERKVFEANHV